MKSFKLILCVNGHILTQRISALSLDDAEKFAHSRIDGTGVQLIDVK